MVKEKPYASDMRARAHFRGLLGGGTPFAHALAIVQEKFGKKALSLRAAQLWRARHRKEKPPVQQPAATPARPPKDALVFSTKHCDRVLGSDGTVHVFRSGDSILLFDADHQQHELKLDWTDFRAAHPHRLLGEHDERNVQAVYFVAGELAVLHAHFEKEGVVRSLLCRVQLDLERKLLTGTDFLLVDGALQHVQTFAESNQIACFYDRLFDGTPSVSVVEISSGWISEPRKPYELAWIHLPFATLIDGAAVGFRPSEFGWMPSVLTTNVMRRMDPHEEQPSPDFQEIAVADETIRSKGCLATGRWGPRVFFFARLNHRERTTSIVAFSFDRKEWKQTAVALRDDFFSMVPLSDEELVVFTRKYVHKKPLTSVYRFQNLHWDSLLDVPLPPDWKPDLQSKLQTQLRPKWWWKDAKGNTHFGESREALLEFVKKLEEEAEKAKNKPPEVITL
ncbi:hypothetical protein M3Y99_00648400 [Aphelenchoides fujianensis]|nr:hypothetical protein M3Y99_00648400 [Aphelenchoides fujianensis]